MSAKTERGPARQAVAAGAGGQDSVQGVRTANAAGRRKLSEVIHEFARTVMADAPAGTLPGAIRVAVVAWNLANMPPDLRRTARADLLAAAGRVGGRYARQLGRVMDRLVERKHQLYPDDGRMVLDHAIAGARRGNHLRVTCGAMPR